MESQILGFQGSVRELAMKASFVAYLIFTPEDDFLLREVLWCIVW